MTTSMPLVSVIIPCFNYARYLPAAIASVRRQRYAPIETIVVDDGSQDGAAAVASGLGVRLIAQPNSGVGSARNVGLSYARGEFIVFLDADDELLPDAVASGVAALCQRPFASCVVRRCTIIDGEGRPLPSTPPMLRSDNLYREWLRGNFAWTPGSAMFRRECLEKIGGFPLCFGPAADYAVYLALARSGGVLFEARDVVRYRHHGSNMSWDHAGMLKATLQVLRLERRHLPPDCAAAFRSGRRAWRSFYGNHIVEALRLSWRAGRWGRAELNQVWVLARYCPGLLMRHAARKLNLIVRERTGLRAQTSESGLRPQT
jgi:GT2 family glycosyltransferase